MIEVIDHDLSDDQLDAIATSLLVSLKGLSAREASGILLGLLTNIARRNSISHEDLKRTLSACMNHVGPS